MTDQLFPLIKLDILQNLKYGTGPIIVAFSGGKDSIAMVLHLMFTLKVPKERIHLHHHDVDGAGPVTFDWPCTESYCRAFAKAFGLQLYFSYRKGGIHREIYRDNEPLQDVYYQQEPNGPYYVLPSNQKAINTRGKFPAVSKSLSTRWCSATVKIDVLRRVVTNSPIYRNLTDLLILTGERWEEGTVNKEGKASGRATYEECEVNSTSNMKRNVVSWRPVLEWTEQQVWDIMKEHNVQPHPCYMLNWSRCSCCTCIYLQPDHWATLQQIAPNRLDAISKIESDTSFTLYHKIDIYQKAALGTAFTNLDPYWIQQAFGSFTAPIITTQWTTPPGAYKKQRSGSE